MNAKAKVWIVFDGEVKFGDGRAHLLELIRDRGSIQQAVRELGMSYRNAWGYLRELEAAAGFKLLERVAGGGARGGTRLTAEGEEFLARYRAFRQAVDRTIEQSFARAFRNPRHP